MAFLQAIHQGELTRIQPTTDDWARVIDLGEQYADLGLGTVDASIVAIAERLEIDVIATLDRRDFAVVQPNRLERANEALYQPDLEPVKMPVILDSSLQPGTA